MDGSFLSVRRYQNLTYEEQQQYVADICSEVDSDYEVCTGINVLR